MRRIRPLFFVMMVLLPLMNNAQSPGGVSGATLWIKADAGTNTTTSGGAISNWDDQSGNSRNFTQATSGRQPSYLINWNNFNPAVDFQFGSVFASDRMAYAGTTPYGSTLDYSIISVLDLDNNGQHQIFGANNSNNPRHTFFSETGSLNTSYIHQIQIGSNVSNNDVGTYTNTLDKPTIALMAFDGVTAGASTGTSVTRNNGAAQNNTNLFTANPANNPMEGMQLGSHLNNFGMIGQMGEVIIFGDKILTPIEMDRLDSYLAVKYGITLAHNYVSTSSTTTFDITMHAAYANDIAGIGRDDATALYQKQSKSINDDALVTMGAGNMIAATNVDNTASFGNGLFMLWGNNDDPLAWTSTESPNPANRQKLEREWRLEETGNVGSVKISVPDDSAGGTTLPSEGSETVYLLYDADGDFSSGAIEIPMMLVGDNWEVDYDFPADGYFTFARSYNPPPLPAGVEGYTMWVKADEGTNTMANGTSVSTWSTVDGAFDLTQSTSTSQPEYIENWSNFNPGVHFTNDYIFNSTNNPWTLGTDGLTQFTAMDVNATGIQQILGSHLAGTNNRAFGYFNSSTTSSVFGQQFGTGFGFTSDNLVTHDYTNATTYVHESSYSGTSGNGTSNGATSIGITTPGLSSEPIGIALGGWRNQQNLLADGHIGEVIIFPTEIATADKAKINTYLALKYGVTLLSPSDYVAPDGTILWDVDATGGFDNDIAGIGNDGYCLNQKQSRSENTDDIVTVSKGPLADLNKNNASVIKKDNYKLWGNNDGSTSTFSMIAANQANVMDRKWQFQETGNVGKVVITVPAANIPAGADNPYFIVSSDPTFDEMDQFYTMTLNGSNYEIEIDCKDGDYFTFGYGPDITVNLSLDKTSSVTSAGSGDAVAITTTVTNAGPTTATEVKIKDAVPLGMTLSSAVPSIGTYNPATGIWFIPTLPPGTATLTLNLNVQ